MTGFQIFSAHKRLLDIMRRILPHVVFMPEPTREKRTEAVIQNNMVIFKAGKRKTQLLRPDAVITTVPNIMGLKHIGFSFRSWGQPVVG